MINMTVEGKAQLLAAVNALQDGDNTTITLQRKNGITKYHFDIRSYTVNRVNSLIQRVRGQIFRTPAKAFK